MKKYKKFEELTQEEKDRLTAEIERSMKKWPHDDEIYGKENKFPLNGNIESSSKCFPYADLAFLILIIGLLVKVISMQ